MRSEIVKAFGQCRRSHLVSDVVASGALQRESLSGFQIVKFTVLGPKINFLGARL